MHMTWRFSTFPSEKRRDRMLLLSAFLFYKEKGRRQELDVSCHGHTPHSHLISNHNLKINGWPLEGMASPGLTGLRQGRPSPGSIRWLRLEMRWIFSLRCCWHGMACFGLVLPAAWLPVQLLSISLHEKNGWPVIISVSISKMAHACIALSTAHCCWHSHSLASFSGRAAQANSLLLFKLSRLKQHACTPHFGNGVASMTTVPALPVA